MTQAGLFDDLVVPDLNLPGADLRLWRGWLPAGEADECFETLLAEADRAQPELKMAGRRIRIPRLQAWYGDPDSGYAYSGEFFQPQPWIPVLAKLRESLQNACNSPFNSVLVNLYRDGNDGVGWHADNERELGPQPVVASLSIGSTRRFLLKPNRFHALPGLQRLALELHNGDLLLMAGSTQRHWLHCVPKTRKPVGARINLTFRVIQ